MDTTALIMRSLSRTSDIWRINSLYWNVVWKTFRGSSFIKQTLCVLQLGVLSVPRQTCVEIKEFQLVAPRISTILQIRHGKIFFVRCSLTKQVHGPEIRYKSAVPTSMQSEKLLPLSQGQSTRSYYELSECNQNIWKKCMMFGIFLFAVEKLQGFHTGSYYELSEFLYLHSTDNMY
jgi:hypothetical protein